MKQSPSLTPSIVAERFLPKIKVTAGCWEWTGHKDRGGYGVFCAVGRVWLAHRLQYQRSYGAIPPGLLVCHHCDNPSCVRPSHLFLGTHADNHHDRDRKGRTRGWAGDNMRKSECVNGHPFDFRDRRGKRVCRRCKADAARRKYKERV